MNYLGAFVWGGSHGAGNLKILSLVAVFHGEVEVLANQKQEKRKGRMPVGATK
jgi:hypothetical protein